MAGNGQHGAARRVPLACAGCGYRALLRADSGPPCPMCRLELWTPDTAVAAPAGLLASGPGYRMSTAPSGRG
jgi:hypothetical protein